MFPGLYQLLPPHLILNLSLVVGLVIHMHLAKRFGVNRGQFFLYGVPFTIVGVAGAKAYSMALDGPVGPYYGLFSGNFRYPGAILAMLAAMPFLRRWRPDGTTTLGCADLAIPGFCFSLAFYRIQCLMVGCCMGRTSSLPWALRFPPYSGPWRVQVAAGEILGSAPESLSVHPLAIYLLLLALALGFLFLRLLPRKAYDGQVLLLFLISHELGKFVLEFLRMPPLRALGVPSLVVGLGATLIYVIVALRRRHSLATGGVRAPAQCSFESIPEAQARR